mmetsp:Transcript_23642/g.35954  ORF Transcript_23642/g.35954 Transcript_23642/m.35954 type:complete len:240 (+) Transcript_23642:160-879(+)
MKSFSLTLLIAAAMATMTQGFSTTTTSQSSLRPTSTSLQSTPAPSNPSTPAPSNPSTPAPSIPSAPATTNQAQYGNETPFPATYAQCGRCQSAFGLTEADLGEGGRGRRLECSVCGHSWFQSKDRLMTLAQGFEINPLPETDMKRIKTNIEEGRSPKFMGDSKLYVGNIAFGSTEDDIRGLFADIGDVGDVALVRDEMGRNRGFGFVTMRTKEDGQKCIDDLDGVELNGRNLAVRESNN